MDKKVIGLLPLLEALRLTHHTSHVNVEGDDFYSNHLLLQRLYEPLVDEFDSILEQAKGGGLSIDACEISDQAYQWIEKWSGEKCLLSRSLKAEKDFQKALEAVVAKLGGKPLGLDNLLRGLAEKHDTAVFLLQQSCCKEVEEL